MSKSPSFVRFIRLALPALGLAGCLTLGAPRLSAVVPNTCSASASPVNLNSQLGSQSVAEIVIQCEVYSSEITDVHVSLNVDVADAQAELFVDSSSYGNPFTSGTDAVQWQCVDLHAGGTPPTTVELRISNLNVDAAQAALTHDTIVANVSLIGGPSVSNNVLTVANIVDPCEYSVSPHSEEFGPEGGTGTLNVTAPNDCVWHAVPSQGWISITAGSSGSGPGQIAYTIEENADTVPRTGSIAVENASAEIRQEPASDEPDLTITSFRAAPGGVTATSVPDAALSIQNRIGGPAGPFRVGFYFSRDETITTADRFSGTTCSFDGLDVFQPVNCETAIAIPPGLAPGTYHLGAIVDDNRKVNETDELNNVRPNELGAVEIGETSDPAPPTEVTNSATSEPGIAPGLLISIFGGPWSGELIAAEGLPYPKELGGFSVEVNGEPIPLIFVDEGQINAMLPFDLEPGSTVEIRVIRDSKASEPLRLVVEPLSPGILTTSMDGTGQAAALGPNNEIADAAHPVGAGQSIQIFCVGLGDVDPPIEAGNPADPNVALHRTVAEVRVTIGGLPAEVDFAGLAPNFSGLYQVNATLDPNVESGLAVPVQIELVLENGETVSSNVATIAVGP